MNPKDVLNWGIVAGVAFVAIKLFKPINDVLSVPGKVTDLVKQGLENVKSGATPVPADQITAGNYGFTAAGFKAIKNRWAISYYDNVDVRKTPSSAGVLAQNITSKGTAIGVIKDFKVEKLPTGNKTWIGVEFIAPGDYLRRTAYVPLRGIYVIQENSDHQIEKFINISRTNALDRSEGKPIYGFKIN